MESVLTTWFASMVDNAPYLAGAAIAMWAMWKELKQCHEGNKRVADTLLDYVMEYRNDRAQ